MSTLFVDVGALAVGILMLKAQFCLHFEARASSVCLYCKRGVGESPSYLRNTSMKPWSEGNIETFDIKAIPSKNSI